MKKLKNQKLAEVELKLELEKPVEKFCPLLDSWCRKDCNWWQEARVEKKKKWKVPFKSKNFWTFKLETIYVLHKGRCRKK